ncbi:MAG TPA: hypothetical protein VFO89_06770 [Thermoanaerobaculia bacterium]|nr:hypothetical protein [Thermoanaerobaculia bacterium]
MAAFLAAALSYPTVVFTVLLGFFLLYALATLFGAADIEWLDGALGVDGADDSGFESALDTFGIAGIPVTIIAGVAAIFAWLASFIADRLLPDSILLDTGILLAAALAGLTISAVAVRPLRGLFQTVDGPHRQQHVGRICEIRSLRVDDHSGIAEIGGIIAEVRCFRDNTLTIGSKAIVYDYDPGTELYHVGPVDASITDVDAVLAAHPASKTAE